MENRKLINQDLEVIKGANSSFFTGVEDTMNLYLDPLVTGYAYIHWVEVPTWFNQDPDLKYFKDLTQKNFRSFQGINEISLESNTHQTGFTGRDINNVGGIQIGNTDFSISHKEYSGSPIRKLYQKWISLIRDPRTGISLYPKLFGVEHGARNHTAQLMYMMVRPDATNDKSENIIEYAAFYSNVYPTNIPLDQLYNYSLGDQDSPVLDIQFKGFVELGPDVEEYAKKILREKILNKSSESGLPFIDSLNIDRDASELFSSDTSRLGNIYNSK